MKKLQISLKFQKRQGRITESSKNETILFPLIKKFYSLLLQIYNSSQPLSDLELLILVGKDLMDKCIQIILQESIFKFVIIIALIVFFESKTLQKLIRLMPKHFKKLF